MKIWITALACLAVASFANVRSQQNAESVPLVINDKKLREDFEEKMAELIKSGDHTPYEKLKEQLSRKSCKLDLPSANTAEMTPADIYQKCIGSVVMVSKLFHCKSNKCEKVHANIASGVVIRENGIVVTNFHVAEGDQPKLIGMGVMTLDGKAFLVDEILAADKDGDVSILKLKDASGLQAAPIFRDEPVGNPATIISHPVGNFYTLTHGCVSRYYLNDKEKCIMNVTADYAKGSSGGGIFNHQGNLVGMVSNTVSITYNNLPLGVDEKDKALEIAENGIKPAIVDGKPLFIGMNHQMTIKNSVASRTILDLFKD
jgi:S1-C subfamily serine protease